MKKTLTMTLLSIAFMGSQAYAADYGLPAGIQEGNILHCFNWTAKQVIEELPNIAAAGFGSVQISPCQRADTKIGSEWHNLYRPYDLAFKSSSYCSEQDLKDLCSQASQYGIKVIVDVVANHVDKTAGYHDTWWDANGRVRWDGGINYGNRYSITHGQLGDYGDVNSESAEVCARAKAYIEQLKSFGVKGIRWDAAKHIGLPSESCNFWTSVCSVSGMWHYGEILDAPGPDKGIIKEYANYMSVTDNQYCNYAARNNGGVPGGYGGDWVVNYGVPDTKMVYWAESHDTYANDEWSQNIDQSVIDRAYAAYACRSGATALYLARPNVKGFDNIKVGKGTSAFKSKAITEVNKFRNVMTGKKDWFESNGNACSITRQNGGAVIVMKGSGNVSITNGGGYCPAGTYTDRISGNKFTVNASTISGNVGSTGIAVLYADGIAPDPTPNPDPDPTPDPTPDGGLWILGNLEGSAGWSTTPGTGVAMTKSGNTFTAKGVKFVCASGETKCYFNLTDYVGATWDDLNMTANRYGAATEGAPVTLGSAATIVKYANNVDASGCLSWTVAPGTYDITADLSAMTITVVNAGSNPDPDPTPDPNPTTNAYCYFENTAGWDVKVWAWNDAENCNTVSSWPGDSMTEKNGKLYWEAPAGKVPTGIIFSNNGGDKAGGGDLVFVNGATYKPDGSYVVGTDPNPNPNPNPDPAGGLWILGNLEGSAGWSTTPGTGIAMTKSGNVYTADAVTFVAASEGAMCYFNLTDYVGATWDDLNMGANRYGAAVEGAPVTLGTPASIVKYANNVDASGCLSWTVAPGTYKVVADLGSMQLTLTDSSSVDAVAIDGAETVYFNLQGIRVDNPAAGIYIRVCGNKVSKVRIP